MKIEAFERRRDLDFYLKGEIETFEHSFPGVGVSAQMRSEMTGMLKSLQPGGTPAAFTLIDDKAAGQASPLAYILLSLDYFFFMPKGHILSIYVSKAQRGKGLSKHLIHKAESWTKEQGAKVLKLDVSLVNEVAINAYLAAGFKHSRSEMEKIL